MWGVLVLVCGGLVVSEESVWRRFDRVDVSSNSGRLPVPDLPSNTPVTKESMLTRGSGLWSSYDNLGADDVVQIDLWTRKPFIIGGLHLEWVIPATELRVQGSVADGLVQDILAWSPINTTELTLNDLAQNVTFPKQFFLDHVTLSLRAPLNNNLMSLNFLCAVVPKSKLFMIVSGITVRSGVDEVCLMQVDSRLYASSCLGAIADYKANELWKLDANNGIVHALSNKLLTVANATTPRLTAPEEMRAGLKQMQLDENNEIRDGTTDCLSMAGSGSDDINKAKGKPVSASSGTVPAKAMVDGSDETQWESEASAQRSFSVEVMVSLESLSGNDRAKGIKIKWAYSARDFDVFGSADASKWTLLRSVMGNQHNTSYVPLNPNTETYQYYKLRLNTANANTGSRHYVYGISELEVLFHGVTVIVESCEQARSHGDARQFFFIVAVSQFDVGTMNAMQQSNSAFTEHVQGVQASQARVADLEYADCAIDADEMRGLTRRSGADLKQIVKYVKYASAKSARFRALPKRCAEQRDGQLGFHLLAPRCLNRAKYSHVRALCPQLGRGLAMVVPRPGEPYLNGTDSKIALTAHCNDMGMVPTDISTTDAVMLAMILVDSSNVCASDQPRFVPFAASDNVAGSIWRDFVGNEVTAMTATLLHQAPGAPLSDKALFGYACDTKGFAFADWEEGRVAGVVCAEVPVPIEPDDAPLLSCVDTFEHLDLSAAVFRCRNDCFAQYLKLKDIKFINSLVYGNNEDGYSPNSSVCFALAHAGLHGTTDEELFPLVITPSAGISHYTGRLQNGIQSQDGEYESDYSYKVAELFAQCSRASKVPKATNVTRLPDPLPLAPAEYLTLDALKVREASHLVYVPEDDNSNQFAVREMLDLQASIHECSNEDYTRLLLKGAQDTIFEARGNIKPIEITVQTANKELARANTMLSTYNQRLLEQVENVMTAYEGAKADLQRQRDRRKSFGSQIWSKAPATDQNEEVVQTMADAFYSVFHQVAAPQYSTNGLMANVTSFGEFEITDLRGASLGPTQGSIRSEQVVVYLPSVAVPVIPCPDDEDAQPGYLFVGSLLYTPHYNVFDGRLAGHFLFDVKTFEGFRARIGLVSKVHDDRNLLVAVLENIDGGRAAIYSVQNGREQLLGSVPWTTLTKLGLDRKWIELSLVSQRDRHSFYLRHPDAATIHLLTVQSEVHATGGGFGVYTNLDKSFSFTDLTWDAMHCQALPLPSSATFDARTPQDCSSMKDDFGYAPNERWNTQGGVWRLNLIDGKRGMSQLRAQATYSYLLLKRPFGCRLGRVSFEYYTKCSADVFVTLRGGQAAVSLSSDTMRLMDVREGTHADFSYEMTLGAWTTVDIELASDYLSVNGNQLRLGMDPNEELRSGLSFGLRGCGGTAIGNVTLTRIDQQAAQRRAQQSAFIQLLTADRDQLEQAPAFKRQEVTAFLGPAASALSSHSQCKTPSFVSQIVDRLVAVR